MWECACECGSVFVCLYWMLVWLLFSKKTGGFLPLAPTPFPPLIMAPWVQADSSSCLFSLIYQARADKCKHLPEDPPHLGALGGWMCSIFYPICGSMHYYYLAVFLAVSSSSSSLLLLHLTQNTITSTLPVDICYYGRWSEALLV